MPRRRSQGRRLGWPVWLAEFRLQDWAGADDVERAWAWFDAALRWCRAHPYPEVDPIEVYKHLRMNRLCHRVRTEEGLSKDELQARGRYQGAFVGNTARTSASGRWAADVEPVRDRVTSPASTDEELNAYAIQALREETEPV